MKSAVILLATLSVTLITGCQPVPQDEMMSVDAQKPVQRSPQAVAGTMIAPVTHE